MNQSILDIQMMKSPLKQQSSLGQKANSKKKANLLFSLNLTALIDAFSILVIFLLSSMNDGAQNLEFKNGMILPSAQKSESLSAGKVVRIENGNFVIEEKTVGTDQLLAKLIEFKKAKPDEAIIIQADKSENYDMISIVIKAASQAGIEKYMLAVLPMKTAGM